ncbi:hypothetical protein HJFPF1_06330 [Paramyrothecium foliicola]|nr:hypothetical protein HJFPF1_06330 [Paramyrothecium foliicola]
MFTTANVAAPLVFAIIILVAVLVFWVVPRRRLRRTDVESANRYVAPRRTRPVSTYKPPSETDMELPPYPAPAHMGPNDPVPSYEEATGQQSRQRAPEPPSYQPGDNANANAARAS